MPSLSHATRVNLEVNRDLARRRASGLSASRSLLGENVVALAEAGRTIALEPVAAVHEVTAIVRRRYGQSEGETLDGFGCNRIVPHPGSRSN